jgi:hypothetical protein
MKMKKFFVLAMVLSLALTAWGYEGYTSTTGGDGGTTVHVTNLDDSGAGSLRAAIAGLSGSATTIVFDVNGCIYPSSEIRITKNNVTVDGSSAPGDGITLVGDGSSLYALFGINSSNVIVKHLRVRDSGKEGIQVWGGSNIVIDHCSITGSMDGALDINNGTTYITVTRCLFANDVECHRSYGNYASLHRNFYAWNNRRQPKIVTTAGPYDFRNNYIEYWQNSGTNCNGTNINIINNYWGDVGPYGNSALGFNILGGTNVYTNGNYNAYEDVDSQGDKGTPNTEPTITTIDAADVPGDVLDDVGAQPTDDIDQYYIDGGGMSPPAITCGGGGGSGGGGGGGGEATFLSPDGSDGTVIESTETSGVGGTYKTTYTYVGDTASKQQQIGILSFDTSSIPDSATITSAVIRIKRLGKGGDPTSLGSIVADIKNGYYGTKTGVEAADFQAASSATSVATIPYPIGNGDWAEGELKSNGKSNINKTGLTQFKIRWTTDDDNDGTADYLNVYDNGDPPQLEVTWTD